MQSEQAALLKRTGFRAWTRDEIEQSIPHRFTCIAAEFSQKIAIKTRTAAWNYAELNERAQHIAHAILKTRGAGPEAVALLFQQGAWVNAATLGVLMAGKMYVPLDPDHPPLRLAGLQADAQAQLLVTDTAHLKQARTLGETNGITVLNVEALEPTGSHVMDLPTVAPTAPAYIYYTSGSTGKPKGVVDTHRNVLHNILRYTNQLALGAGDRMTLLQAPAFSGAVSSLFCAVLNGATSLPVYVRGENPDALAEWLIDERVTVYHSVPALFRSLMRQGRMFPDMRVVRLEGDAASRREVELFRAHFSNRAVLVNGLGTTETNLVRQFFVNRTTPLAGHLLPVGYAVPDVRVRIVDDDGSDLGTGQVGEIAVTSAYLARGYWNDPQATADKFFPAQQGGDEREYRTGDLGRLSADGCLEYFGRKDFRVKVRGQFAAPTEIESALLDLPGIRAAAVVARPNRWDENELVAFVIPVNGTPPPVREMRAALLQRLPAVLVPAKFVWLDKLPLSGNGKVDRRALQNRVLDDTPAGTEYESPENQEQATLARIWQTVLGVERVGIHTPFFELGGDSLRAFQILARVRDEFNIELTAQEFFEAPTIVAQAALVRTKPIRRASPISRRPR